MAMLYAGRIGEDRYRPGKDDYAGVELKRKLVEGLNEYDIGVRPFSDPYPEPGESIYQLQDGTMLRLSVEGETGGKHPFFKARLLVGGPSENDAALLNIADMAFKELIGNYARTASGTALQETEMVWTD